MRSPHDTLHFVLRQLASLHDKIQLNFLHFVDSHIAIFNARVVVLSVFFFANDASKKLLGDETLC